MIYVFGFLLFLLCLPLGLTVYLAILDFRMAILKRRMQRCELILFGEIRTP